MRYCSCYYAVCIKGIHFNPTMREETPCLLRLGEYPKNTWYLLLLLCKIYRENLCAGWEFCEEQSVVITIFSLHFFGLPGPSRLGRICPGRVRYYSCTRYTSRGVSTSGCLHLLRERKCTGIIIFFNYSKHVRCGFDKFRVDAHLCKLRDTPTCRSFVLWMLSG